MSGVRWMTWLDLWLDIVPTLLVNMPCNKCYVGLAARRVSWPKCLIERKLAFKNVNTPSSNMRCERYHTVGF